MTDAAPTKGVDPLEALLASYTPAAGVADELMQPDGSPRPVWTPLMQQLAGLPMDDLEARFARGDQYLHDTGVYFRKYSASGSDERDWPLSHIPVMISEQEWQGLADGIIQRADLLEQVMADLYGPGQLVADGLLPPELVAQNPEWLRPLVGIQPRSGHHLHFLAFELGRSPDGSWFVLGDRTQAPSGAGFALENRMATARVFHELFAESNVERLAGFFRQFRDTLHSQRAGGDERVAILTPGQHTDTYFEHAYIARYLGISLLECEDLRVENGQLTVRTIHGSEPISVLWRRLDARWADPLELDETSAIGAPGMVSAVRSGAVSMINSLGSGALEARAFMAFLPRICERLTGAPLKLPNIATWWCGQESERQYVIDNLERMLIGPAQSTNLPFDMEAGSLMGGKFRGDGPGPVEEWLTKNGPTLVGQEAVSLSTTPAMIDGKLVPRPMVVRVFAARTQQGWQVMPGGYARIGRTEDPTAIGMQEGGSVADVWIMSDKPVDTDTLDEADTGPFIRRLPGKLPARAADNLFWLGRYIERAEGAVRLCRSYNRRFETYTPGALPLVEALRSYMGGWGLSADEGVPEGILSLTVNASQCASRVRDRFSPDGWNALRDLERSAKDLSERVQPGADAASAMGVLLRKIGGFSGLVHENMFRFDGWRFLTIGRALERADQIAAILATFCDPMAPPGGFDVAVELGDSEMTHRRRYSVETGRNTVIDLLALDVDNPRSLHFQIDRLQREEARLSERAIHGPVDETGKLILTLQTELAIAEPAELTTERLIQIRGSLAQISNALATQFLS